MINLYSVTLTLLVFMSSKVMATPELKSLEIEISNIGNNAYIATDKTYHNSNVLIVKLKDRTVFIISSPFENQGATQMMEWIKGNLNPKKIIAVNTHYHLDGTGGNSVYHQYGVETWASQETTRLQQKKGETLRKKAASSFPAGLKTRVLETPIVEAKNTFSLIQGKKFKIGDEVVEVYYPGHAHSPDNVVVYFNKRKILFGGCMIKPGKSLGYLGDANVITWVQAAKNLKRFDVEIVIPGHHPWGGPQQIETTLQNAIKVAKKNKK